MILVDDHSTDETVRMARQLPLHLVWHPHQVGYGGNQKTCYIRRSSAAPTSPRCFTPTASTSGDDPGCPADPRRGSGFVWDQGSRCPARRSPPGMPRWKYLANRFLTVIENRLLARTFEGRYGIAPNSRPWS